MVRMHGNGPEVKPGNCTWGTMEAKAVVHAEKELTVEEVLAITKRAESDSSLVSLVPPVKPKAGDVFVYSHAGNRDRRGY